jgi:hypothetical protein
MNIHKDINVSVDEVFEEFFKKQEKFNSKLLILL